MLLFLSACHTEPAVNGTYLWTMDTEAELSEYGHDNTGAMFRLSGDVKVLGEYSIKVIPSGSSDQTHFQLPLREERLARWIGRDRVSLTVYLPPENQLNPTDFFLGMADVTGGSWSWVDGTSWDETELTDGWNNIVWTLPDEMSNLNPDHEYTLFFMTRDNMVPREDGIRMPLYEPFYIDGIRMLDLNEEPLILWDDPLVQHRPGDPDRRNNVLASQEPRQIVLTWEGDTRSTMTITWRTDEPNALTNGMRRTNEVAATNPDIDFTEVRNLLAGNHWQDAGYNTPEEAFIDLSIGIMNHTGRDSRFAYQFLLNNWSTYTEEIGFQQQLLPDRDEWNAIYHGGAVNRIAYTDDPEVMHAVVDNALQQRIDDPGYPKDHEPGNSVILDAADIEHGMSVRKATTYTFAETSAWLHTVKLTDLKPGTRYHVLVHREDENEPGRFVSSEPFHFRTAPDDREEITFIMGADTQSATRERREMTAHAASLDPDFVAIGGDLVMGGMSEFEWDLWFDEWHELMITEDGRRVPVLPALGNHDVRGWVAGDFETDAAFYANRFNLPDPKKYYVIEYGDGLVLFTLDSGHTSAFNEELNWFEDTGYYEGGPHQVQSSHDGLQIEWLQEMLSTYQDRPWLIGQYHINAFATSPRYWEKPRYGRHLMRKHWIPLFEQYGVNLIHEGHGHRLKRTHPVKDFEINEDGIVYIGDGGWGTHMGQPEDMWFVADKAPNHHFWKLTLEQGWHTLNGLPIKWIDGAAVRGESFQLESRR